MITCKLKGGLGNQMFQVASTIGVAVKNRLTFGFESKEHIFRKLPKLDNYDKKVVRVPWGYHDIRIEDNVILDGYMQSERYFSHCQYLIKYFFEIDEWLGLYNPYSVIHFRGGDYIGNECHDVLNKRYWDLATSMLLDKSIEVRTDDADAAYKVFGDKYRIISGDYMDDLYAITQARSIVMSNSTFSWWGAWLSDAERVIAPKDWFGGKKSNWDTKDIYCKKWIVI